MRYSDWSPKKRKKNCADRHCASASSALPVPTWVMRHAPPRAYMGNVVCMCSSGPVSLSRSLGRDDVRHLVMTSVKRSGPGCEYNPNAKLI